MNPLYRSITRANALALRLLRPWLAAGRVARSWQSGGPAVVIAPHPDDETLGAGGVIASHIAAGDPIRIVVVSDGRASRAGGLDGDEMAGRRGDELAAAAAALGVSDLVHLRFPERAWPPAAVAAALAPLLADAALVYAPSPVDFHPDHLALARLLGRLIPPARRVRIVELGVPLGPALVNLVADIGPVAGQKAAALAAHASQDGALQPLARVAHYRAALHGPAAAELFWELPAAGYARLAAAADWSWQTTPFRGFRGRPLTDLLAYTTGHRARLALQALAEGGTL